MFVAVLISVASADAVVLPADVSEEGYDVRFDVNPPSISYQHQSIGEQMKIE